MVYKEIMVKNSSFSIIRLVVGYFEIHRLAFSAFSRSCLLKYQVLNVQQCLNSLNFETLFFLSVEGYTVLLTNHEEGGAKVHMCYLLSVRVLDLLDGIFNS